jgi:GTP-binding protein
MDTGGWDSKAEGLEEQVSLAAELAIEISDVLVFVVDTRVGVQLQDEQLLKLIRKSNKPCILVGNKVDNEQEELDSMELWNLGLGEPAFVSALHGRGSGDLLDRVVSELKKADLNKTNLASLDNSDEEADIYNPIRSVALVGKPNVGKSSLLNQLAGDKRVVVSDVAGTTRDPVD